MTRIEVLRAGEWFPGTVTGFERDPERGPVIDVALDQPNRLGLAGVFVRPGSGSYRNILVDSKREA